MASPVIASQRAVYTVAIGGKKRRFLTAGRGDAVSAIVAAADRLEDRRIDATHDPRPCAWPRPFARGADR